MKCKDCLYKKEIDAIEVMEGAPDWVCTRKHTECKDIVCLLRMVIWSLSHLEDNNVKDT
jgi:hypothetical protein